MSTPADVRNRLETLRIPREQRPESTRTASRGRGKLWLGLFLAVAIVAAAGFGYANREKLVKLTASAPAEESLRFLTVSAAADDAPPPVLTATGKIVSDHLVQVATKVSGQITALYFEQGDHMKQGQLLAKVEEDLYRANRDEASAFLARAKAELAYEEVNFARVQRLAETNDTNPIEQAEARKGIDAARASVGAAEAALAAAQKSLDDCRVLAPIDGVILERAVEVGDFVAAEGGRGANANAQFAVIADMDKLRVEVDVSELDIARLRADMPCTVIPDAYKDRKYDGFIMWIDPGANYSKATVQVKVRILNPDAYLRVEGSAQVIFLSERPSATAERVKPSIWIPKSACKVHNDGASGTVFVEGEKQLISTAVTLGRSAGSQIEVLSGLEPGQRIVADDVEKLAGP
ncbi:MAG: efflux RND transporter periplasmic adaptor subunit [Phycisphaerae bacterium]|nr:efflux RND transporter periplasmic adaptor subunit [Phycisphaerae bacterium]